MSALSGLVSTAFSAHRRRSSSKKLTSRAVSPEARTRAGLRRSLIGAQEMLGPKPSFGVDAREPAAVDAAHTERERGVEVVSVEDRFVDVLEAHAVEAGVLRMDPVAAGSPSENGSAPGCGGCAASPSAASIARAHSLFSCRCQTSSTRRARVEGRRRCWRTRRPDR
jgi:hypothetical protein